jgi:outer membrane protein assembly factor BamB/mono/diheme cytochrome c family protein
MMAPWAVALFAVTERSKVPFYIAAGALVVWALGLSLVGSTRSSTFRGSRRGLAACIAVTALLVIGTMTTAVATSGSVPSPPWSLTNGDLSNTRETHGSEISSANVAQLGVAWTMPLTASSVYGTFAANPVTDAHGVVYLQDLASNVFAVDLRSGRVLWTRRYGSQDIGPNGVTVVDGRVYGATAAFAFALDAKTGRELWRNTHLVPPHRKAAGGEFASGFGIDIQPQVTGGKVYLATAALLGGGIAYALDAQTGRTLWSFDTVPDPAAGRVIAGGSWNPPAIGSDGTAYFGIGNMYQSAQIAVNSPSRRLYTDSTVALDAKSGHLKWDFQAVPDDFHDWDMHLSPILAQRKGREVVINAGKMGYVYAMDAATGRLVWKTRVGVHNGHDADGELALAHKLPMPPATFTVEPGIVGGVETNMALADGVIYVPVANLASLWSVTSGLGKATFGDGRGELLALDLDTGKVLWDTQLSQMADGDATVSNDLVFTTTFDGYLVAIARDDGHLVWRQKLPAFTNAPIAIEGDTLVTAASYPGGKGQTPEVIAFRLGAHGSFTPAPGAAPGGAGGGNANGASVFAANCSSCHTLAAAHANGTVGPNLDQLKPTAALVNRQVTNGGGGMPAFGGRLSAAQIDAVAKYVSSVAGQ